MSAAAAEQQLLARWGEARIEPDRDRIRAALDLLGAPQTAYAAIHITGTNGKTSTARMIDALLREFGLRVGRYTSPHLQSITERIVVDGEPVDDATFSATYFDIAPTLALADDRSATKLSFFEAITALAYTIFAEVPIDVAVVEVGMGGSWDATNVIDARVAVITPIGLDHTEFLGDTIAAIATEKAGIIKADAAAIFAAQPAEAAGPLLTQAALVRARVAREGPEFGVLDRRLAVGGQLLTLQGVAGIYDEVFLPLHGRHQAQNAAVALAAVEAFFGADGGRGPLDIDVVRAAFAAVRSPGRLEVMRSSPTVLVDAAHNPHGLAATIAAVTEEFAFRRLVVVFAALGDKDIAGMLDLLEPVADHLVISESSSPRAMPADELGDLAAETFGVDRVTVAQRLDDAIDAAVALAEQDGDETGLAGAGVLVVGSVVTAGEARTLLARTKR